MIGERPEQPVAGRDAQRVDQPALGIDLLEEHRRRHAEAGIHGVVVEHAGLPSATAGARALPGQPSGSSVTHGVNRLACPVEYDPFTTKLPRQEPGPNIGAGGRAGEWPGRDQLVMPTAAAALCAATAVLRTT